MGSNWLTRVWLNSWSRQIPFRPVSSTSSKRRKLGLAKSRPELENLEPRQVLAVGIGSEFDHNESPVSTVLSSYASNPSNPALQNLVSVDAAGRIGIRVTAADIPAALSDLAKLGFVTAGSRPDLHFAEGYLPTSSVAQLQSLKTAGLMGFTPIFKAQTATGSVNYQGDPALQSDRTRNGLPLRYDGSGVTIGVVSDSYNNKTGAASDIATGDLPSGVNVLQDLTTGTGSDEGRAMLQLIHDIAPGAGLAFATGFISEVSMADNIRKLQSQAGARIITDDVFYFDEPMFQDGPIAQAINEVVGKGVSYFSLAGNLEKQAWEQTTIRTANDTLGGKTNQFINFDTAATPDTRQRITIPANGTVTLTLQWDDPFYTTSGVRSDLDIFLVDPATGRSLGTGGTDNNIQSQTPTETVTFTAGGTATDVDVMIRLSGGQTPGRVKYVNYGRNNGTIITFKELATSNTPTVIPHAAATSAMSVAAVPYYDHASAEGFSSYGPSTILFAADGTRLSAAEVRQTPKLSAVDGVNTTFFGSDAGPDADTLPNFFGTSAAAPAAAAVGALVLQANPSFTPALLYNQLISTAVDIGATGYDNVTGYGRIDAWRAVRGPIVPYTTSLPDLDFTEKFENLPALSSNWELDSTGNGRISISSTNNPDTGTGHLILDSQDPGSVASLSEATLSVNMTRLANAKLVFRQKEFNDSDDPMPGQFSKSSNSDGVAISYDGGSNWYRLMSLTGTQSSNFYRTFSFDLNQQAATNGQKLGADVRIRFQTYSRNPAGTGGMAFDNISVTGTYVNNPPTLTKVIPLTGATESLPYAIPFSTLQFAADEADPDGDAVFFKINAIKNGTLTKNGIPVLSGTTFNVGETLEWTGGLEQYGVVTAFSIVATDGQKDSVTPIDVQVVVTPVDNVPRFVIANTLTGAQRNTPFTIDYNLLTNNYIAVDPDTPGPVSYIVSEVTSGSLTKNGNPVTSAVTFVPGDVLVWNPPSGPNSAAPAFRIIAQSSGGQQSAPQQVRVQLPNSAPQMVIVGAIGGGVEDIPLNFDATLLASKARATDPDGDPVFFRVTSLTPGARLLVNGSPVEVGVTLIDSAATLQFTPPLNANGTVVGFYAIATDGDKESAPPLPVLFDVVPIYDPPVIQPMPTPLVNVVDGVPQSFTFDQLVTLTGSQAVDGNLSFHLKAVLNGNLTINGSPAVPGATFIRQGDLVVWTPAPGSIGLVRAFALATNDGLTESPNDVEIQGTVSLTRLYRTYNPNAGYHFFTTSPYEFSVVVSRGLADETSNRAGFAVGTMPTPESTGLLRLRNPTTGRHYYTGNPEERDSLVTKGWIFERTEGYIFTSQIPGSVPIYRLYNVNTGTHLYTENAGTKDSILAQFPGVWLQHTDLGFAFPLSADTPVATGIPISVPEQPSSPPRAGSTPVSRGLELPPTGTSGSTASSGTVITANVSGLIAVPPVTAPLVAPSNTAETGADQPASSAAPAVPAPSTGVLDQVWSSLSQGLGSGLAATGSLLD